MNLADIKLAIIGLGYVGLPLAVEFGKQRTVVGFDINPQRIAQLRSGHDQTLETEPEELRAASHLTFSTELEDLRNCNCFIVTVPTPIDEHKRPDLTPLIKASETVGKVLKPGDIVIYESTVYPGCTEEDCVPVLEKFSGLKYISSAPVIASEARQSMAPDCMDCHVAGAPRNDGQVCFDEPGTAATDGFYCGYSPERINPGDKLHRVTTIKKITSGSTPQVADLVDALYRQIITAGTHQAPSIKVAEAAKVIENTQRDVNIALINELALIFVDVQNPAAVSAAQMDIWVSQGLVKYLGVSDDVRAEIAAADCIVLPSYREGTPRTLLEAAAIGRPIITTDAVGCREVVDDGVNGYLCQVRDAKNLADKMEQMLRLSPDQRTEMGLRGRAKMEAEFDEQIVIDKYLAAIAQLTNRSRP